MIECISLRNGTRIPNPERTVLALGSFDGVHLAHQALLRETVEWQKNTYPKATVGVFCFRDLPSESLLGTPVGRLCSFEERLARFASCGMELAITADFADLRSLTPEVYVRDFLIGQCGCVAVACGYNHRFGRGGAGTPALLHKLFEGRVLVREQMHSNGEPISSTRIRSLLAEGNVREAAQLLGTPYTLASRVVHGKALGRKMGFPTVNQNLPVYAAPLKFGVYATSCRIKDRVYYGVTNVGVRPTVEERKEVNCETYLLDFEGDLYSQEIAVSFLHFIRSELRFASVEALTAQIEKDIRAVRQRIAKLD